MLITGATGDQGGHLARLLLQRGQPVRVLVRDPQEPAAIDLAERGADVFEGDLRDAESVERAARGVRAAYLMTVPYDGVEDEVDQGRAAADAFKAADVPFLVHSSVAGSDRDTGIPEFDSKRRIERHIDGLGIPHAVVAPVTFMENLVTLPDFVESLREGRLELPLPPEKPLQMVALRDLAEVTAHILDDADHHRGKRIEVASDEVTPARMVSILSRATGRRIQHVRGDLDALRERDADHAAMWEWLESVGYGVDVPALHRTYAGVPWHKFEDWCEVQDWTILRQDAARQQPARR